MMVDWSRLMALYPIMDQLQVISSSLLSGQWTNAHQSERATRLAIMWCACVASTFEKTYDSASKPRARADFQWGKITPFHWSRAGQGEQGGFPIPVALRVQTV
eukprot:scaffold113792_cov35-Prasinocladus_malaysianus.AAC.2